MLYGHKSYNSKILIEPSNYSFSGIKIKEGTYKIGANKEQFYYDNELPNHKIFLKDFIISKNILTISEWLGFMEEGGYKKKSTGLVWVGIGKLKIK